MNFLRHIMYIRALRQAVASTSMYMSNSSRLASSSYVTKYWSWGASNDYLNRFYALCSDFFGGPSSGMPAIAAAGAPVFEAAEHESAASPLDWDGLFRAAPKKKVSHSRKAMKQRSEGSCWYVSCQAMVANTRYRALRGMFTPKIAAPFV